MSSKYVPFKTFLQAFAVTAVIGLLAHQIDPVDEHLDTAL